MPMTNIKFGLIMLVALALFWLGKQVGIAYEHESSISKMTAYREIMVEKMRVKDEAHSRLINAMVEINEGASYDEP